MRKLFSILLSVFVVLSIFQYTGTNVHAVSEVALDKNNFPDANFRACIAEFDNGDGKLTESEISKITELNCSNKNISSVEGVEYLTSLRLLDVGKNKLTSLDFENSVIKTLWCQNNNLTSINVTKMPSLSNLDCSHNKLTKLDVSQNKELNCLSCYCNQLKQIITCEDNNDLYSFRAYDNNISSIDISGYFRILKVYNKGVSLYEEYVGNGRMEVNRCFDSSSSYLFEFDKDTDILSVRVYTSMTSDNAGTVTPTFVAKDGETVSVTAKAKSGYKFVKWQEYDLYGKLKDVSTNSTYSFTTSKESRNLVAVFEEIPKTFDDYLPSDCVKDFSGSEGFVFRLYQCTFGRDPDEEGFLYWYDLLSTFKITGADAARSFLLSPEFASMNYSDEEYVRVLYRVFFNRDCDSDPSGKEYWLNLITSKKITRADAVGFFVDSQEWADTCALGGIRSGTSFVPKINVYPNISVKSFTERLYKTALKRDVDYPGMAYWAVLLASHRITGEEVGLQFFISKELQDQNISDEEFINRLYLTFMGRKGESDGISYWKDLLQKGTSRESVVLGFTRSQEYLDRCVDAGILPYKM